MISAALLALVSLSSPAAAPVSAGYAGETVAAMKGHPTPARGAPVARSSAPVACHPEPSKGRVCRHNIAQAEQTERAALAQADAGTAREHAR
ncbi:hypothetical protein [Novosphingobium sp. BL-52-GroH]|uniref:hypothetical protein n=1 Tax=Novosphingobium sp. BL-52-GroH TaxID=3349877 RepID=UPI00384D1771